MSEQTENVTAPRVKAHERPLSPHLGIYRPQITSVTSITHRASGVFLSVGLVAFVIWLWLAAYCPEHYATVTGYNATLWGKTLLGLWSLAFFYHFLNGVRHLGWDMGHGLDIDAATRSGWLSIIGSLVITGFIWYLLLV